MSPSRRVWLNLKNHYPPAAKAAIDFARLTARLKPRPFKANSNWPIGSLAPAAATGFAIMKCPDLDGSHPCGSGGTGRHTILRGWRRKAWGFKSPLPHQRAGHRPLSTQRDSYAPGDDECAADQNGERGCLPEFYARYDLCQQEEKHDVDA